MVDEIHRRQLDVHALAVVHRGKTAQMRFWSPYHPQARHVLYSLTKTFTALGVLFAVQERRLSQDDKVLSFFPRAWWENPSERWQSLTVRHLLIMSLGMDADPIDKVVTTREWVRSLLALPLDHDPGSRFVYNNMASYLASAVLQAATGETLKSWLTPRFFCPLGIEDPPWDRCPTGRTIGGWGLYLTLEEVTKLGVFCLGRGVWEDKVLLEPALFDQAAAFQIATGSNPHHDSHQGYGYQIWRCRHGAFRADGAFGQLCVVRPDLDLVVAVQAGVADPQGLLDLIWSHWDKPEHSEPVLQHLPPTLGEPQETANDRFTAWRGRCWSLDEHPNGWTELGFAATLRGPSFWYRDARGRHEAPFGWGEWVESYNRLWRHDSEVRRRFHNRVSGRWDGPRTLVLTLRFLEQAPVVTLTLERQGENLLLSQHLSVTMRPSNFSNLRGDPRVPE